MQNKYILIFESLYFCANRNEYLPRATIRVFSFNTNRGRSDWLKTILKSGDEVLYFAEILESKKYDFLCKYKDFIKNLKEQEDFLQTILIDQNCAILNKNSEIRFKEILAKYSLINKIKDIKIQRKEYKI